MVALQAATSRSEKLRYAPCMKLSFNRRDAVRGGVAGAEAVASRSAAQVLFEAGGRKGLPAAPQRARRGAGERGASRGLGGGAVLGAGAPPGVAPPAERVGARGGAIRAELEAATAVTGPLG